MLVRDSRVFLPQRGAGGVTPNNTIMYGCSELRIHVGWCITMVKHKYSAISQATALVMSHYYDDSSPIISVVLLVLILATEVNPFTLVHNYNAVNYNSLLYNISCTSTYHWFGPLSSHGLLVLFS